MTSILEVERSLNSCTLAVHRPLAYFRSDNLKTFCKYAKSIIKDANCFVKKWEMAATTTNQRLKGTCIAWVHHFPSAAANFTILPIIVVRKKGYICVFRIDFFRGLPEVPFRLRPKA